MVIGGACLRDDRGQRLRLQPPRGGGERQRVQRLRGLASTTSSRAAHTGRLQGPALRRARDGEAARGHGYGGDAGDVLRDRPTTRSAGEQDYTVLTWPQDAPGASMLRGRPTRARTSTHNVAGPRRPRRGRSSSSVRRRRGLDEDRPSTLQPSAPPATSYDTDYTTRDRHRRLRRRRPHRRLPRQRHRLVLLPRRASARGSSCTPPTSAPTSSAFADVDNDGITDVLYATRRRPARLPEGAAARALVPLTTSPVPMKDLRFGDFDGDGRTDIFYTPQQAVAHLVRQHPRLDSTADSVTPARRAALRRVRRRDAAPTSSPCATSGWSYSSGADGPVGEAQQQAHELVRRRRWRPTSTATAGATSRSTTGSKWRYSRDGSRPAQGDAQGQPQPLYPFLQYLLVGHLRRWPQGRVRQLEERAARPRAVRPSSRFVIWRGLGNRTSWSSGPRRTCAERSGQAVRVGEGGADDLGSGRRTWCSRTAGLLTCGFLVGDRQAISWEGERAWPGAGDGRPRSGWSS